jgi:hypothetical protein
MDGAGIEGAGMDAVAAGWSVGHGAEAGCCCCGAALGQGSVCACAAMAQLVAITSASGRTRVVTRAEVMDVISRSRTVPDH